MESVGDRRAGVHVAAHVGVGFQEWVQVFNLHKNHAGLGLTAG
jgi:hypothetical protein